MLSQVQLYVVLLVVGCGERAAWLAGFSLLNILHSISPLFTASARSRRLGLCVFQAHPKQQRGLSGRQATLRTSLSHRISCHCDAEGWLYGYIRYGTLDYVGSICRKSKEFFVFSSPPLSPFRMSKPFDRAPHLSYDLHPREISALWLVWFEHAVPPRVHDGATQYSPADMIQSVSSTS